MLYLLIIYCIFAYSFMTGAFNWHEVDWSYWIYILTFILSPITVLIYIGYKLGGKFSSWTYFIN